MKSIHTILVLIVVIGFQVSLIAQTKVSGKVIDTLNQDPVIGATVLCLDDPTVFTVSNVDGQFHFEIPDKYINSSFAINSLGYVEKVVQLNAKDENDISMSPMDYGLEMVIVSSSKATASEFVSKSFNRLDVYTNPLSRADPVRAVNALPYSTNVEESANLSLRGSPPTETTYTLNEVPVYDAFRLDQINGVGQFSIFNNSILSSIDIFPSNPPLEFGNSTSGVISMYTDDYGGANVRSVSLTLASLGFNFGQRIGQRNHLVGFGNVNFEEGLRGLNQKTFKNILDFRAADAGVYFLSNISERVAIKFFNYTLAESYDYRYKHSSTTDVFEQQKSKNLSVLNFYYRFKYGSIDINQGYDYSNGNYGFGNLISDIGNRNYYLSINSSTIYEKWSLRSGSSWDFRKNFIKGQYPLYEYALRQDDPVTEVADTTQVKSPESFIYGKYFVSDKVAVGGGIRWRGKMKSGIKPFLSSQLNTKISLTSSQTLHFGIGRYHQVQIFGSDESDDKPYLLRSDHISAEYKLTNEIWELSTALYTKRTHYLKELNNIKGAEFFCQYTKKRIKTSLAFSHVQSTFESEDLKYDSKYDLSYFLRHIFKLDMGQGMELSSVVLFREGSNYLPVIGSEYDESLDLYRPIYSSLDDKKRLDPYFTFDLTLSKILDLKKGSMVLFASATNLTNKKNQRGIDYSRDFQQQGNLYFTGRVIFFGGVYNWGEQ